MSIPICVLCAGLLLVAPVEARAVGEETAPTTAVRLLADLKETRGAQRYRALAAAGEGLDPQGLSELLAASLSGGADDPVERVLLASLLHRKLTPPERGAAPTGAMVDRLSGFIPRLAGDRDWRVRLAAAELLGDLGTELTLVSHRVLTRDPIWPVRLRAIVALAALPPGENVRVLESILSLRDEVSIPERIESTKALARMGQVPSLLTGLGDPNPEVQLNAAWGLARHRSLPLEALRTLERTMQKTTSPRVREEIRLILERPPPPVKRKP